jgi:tetratricopeptide (TPR) repeat protein
MKKVLFASALLAAVSLQAQSPEFKKAFEEANVKYKAKSYTAAIPLYDKAIKNIADDASTAIELKKINTPETKYMAEAYSKRGMCYYFTGSTFAMKSDADMALKLDTGNADAKALNAYNLHKGGGADKKKTCKAIRKAILAGSEGGQKIFEECFCWSEGHNLTKEAESKANVMKWDEAIGYANDAIAIQPDSGNAYAARARGYLGKGEAEKALADMNMAISKKATSHKIYYYRAQVYLKAGKPDSAFLDLNKCIELKKDNYDAILLRAEVNEELQQWNAAIYDYNLLIKMRPDFGRNYYKAALVKHNKQDDLLGACDYYKAAAARGVEEAQEMAKNCDTPKYMRQHLKKDGTK